MNFWAGLKADLAALRSTGNPSSRTGMDGSSTNPVTGVAQGFTTTDPALIAQLLTDPDARARYRKAANRGYYWEYSHTSYTAHDGTHTVVGHSKKVWLREDAQGGGGPGWEAYVAAATSVGSELYYSKTYGTWMGKNFKIYQQTWGGNGIAGGKNKFGKTTSNGFKWAGRLVGVYSGYRTIEQRVNGEIGTGWMLAELGTTGVSTFGGLYGAAWGIGWEIGRFITSMEGYQEAKFNFWYNHWESQVGPPSQSNEALWYYFYQNYKP